jgi:REP element-mobilizing transposase RayT
MAEEKPDMSATHEARPRKANKGWHSRGYLPHFDSPAEMQSITFRLYDAVPMHLIQQWKRELAWHQNLPPADPKVAALIERIAIYEDAGHGACFLHDARIAEMVENALLHFDGKRYRMLAWCVMPNHVHNLIETIAGFPLGEVVHSWKSFTAKQANRILGRSGVFWMEDYFDRFIRDEDHLHDTIHYIEQNPVKAGLVANAADWKYSSARRPRSILGIPLGLAILEEHLDYFSRIGV